jgi:acyl dehydratase
MVYDLYYEDFVPGELYRHWPGKTVTEADHVLFCLLTHNTHPIHIDAHFAERATRYGKILVVSTYLVSVLVGMSMADILQNSTRGIDFENIRHVAPVFHGDTIYGETSVLAKEPPKANQPTGIVSFETRGYKQDGTLVLSLQQRVAVRLASSQATGPSRYSPEFEAKARESFESQVIEQLPEGRPAAPRRGDPS